MPQFLDCCACNDPVNGNTGALASLLIDPDDIASMRETTEVEKTLLRVGWSCARAQEHAQENESLLGIVLHSAPGRVCWVNHDLDVILRATKYLQEHPSELVVMVDDMPAAVAA